MISERQKHIRNFCIIAHIDHGKSTLADRLIEKTGVLTEREMQNQVLDNMDLERERGITIKLQPARLVYKAHDGQEYILNLIDTPGHVDFTYEVSRSLSACDGALLVIDATQGIEAQTLANTYLAMEHDLKLIPVINKIDLPSAQPDMVKGEIESVLGIDSSEAILTSAKEGIGIEDVLESIVKRIPYPEGDEEGPLKSLIFDSFYDNYKGAIAIVRVKEGSVKVGSRIRMMSTGLVSEVTELGLFRPKPVPCDELEAGDVGYIAASMKDVSDTRVGDTITDDENPAAQPLPGFKRIPPMVFSSIYPYDSSNYEELKTALEKLQLNDASLTFEPDNSIALGFGFRCGFLGLLHMDIVQERLEREYNLDVITTAPTVVYRITKTDGEVVYLDNPTNFPDPTEIEKTEEPIADSNVMLPKDFIGPIMELCEERRGVYKGMQYLDTNRVILEYELPLNEIIYDFFDAMKSRSRGYASLDYELKGYKDSSLTKLDILVNGEMVDALSIIVHKDKAYERARKIALRLKESIPRQLFEIPIQATVGSKIIARETVKALRKDVLSKCYGGDITRKKKLLEKQKQGKKRMRKVGEVEIPQEAFMSVLKLGDD